MTTEPLSDYARFKREVSAAQRDELAFARWKEQQPKTTYATCGGSGWIGGPTFYNPGEGGEPCKDCSPT